MHVHRREEGYIGRRMLGMGIPVRRKRRFLILSILATPRENLSTFISATSSSASCLLVNATSSKLYVIAGLTNVLYTSPSFLLISSCRRSLLSPFSILSNLPVLSCLRLYCTLHYSGLKKVKVVPYTFVHRGVPVRENTMLSHRHVR